jgi:predicted nucleic acid-binding Zn finger protein
MNSPWTRLEREKTLSPELADEIVRLYGERGKKAIDAVRKGNVKKYLDFFVVVGRSDEYVVEEELCTCSDFVYRGGECWHRLAVRIARETGEYEEYSLWYHENWTDRQ